MAGSLSGAYRRLRSAAARRAVVVAPWLLAARRGGGKKRPAFSSAALDAWVRGERGGSFSAPGDELSLAALAQGRYLHPRFIDPAGYERPPAGTVFTSVCNDKYAPGLEALLLSLIEVYPGLDARYVVYHDGGLSELSRDRLAGIYPAIEFVESSTDRYRVSLGDHYNHRKVGLLGYLTLDALAVDAPWLIVLDTDLLVLGDISWLWQGDTIKVAPDIGHRPFGVVSAHTGKPVINSGVIALPASELGPDAVERAARTLSTIDANTDPDIAMFADQKLWNVYLAGREVELLPQNYNAIKTLVTHHYPVELGSVRILHLTGPKPWYDVVHDGFLSAEDRLRFEHASREFAGAFALWNRLYRSAVAASRLARFRAERSERIAALAGTGAGRHAVIIAGSLAEVGRPDDGTITIAAASVVTEPGYAAAGIDHVILDDPAIFGGWHAPSPAFEPAWLAALTTATERPRLWLPFYLEPYARTLAELADFEVEYFLLERPAVRTVETYGTVETDLLAPLTSARQAVITLGAVVAAHLSVEQLTLLGHPDPYASAAVGVALRPHNIPVLVPDQTSSGAPRNTL